MPANDPQGVTAEAGSPDATNRGSLGQGTGPRRVDSRAAYRASFRPAYPKQKSVVRMLDEHSQAELMNPPRIKIVDFAFTNVSVCDSSIKWITELLVAFSPALRDRFASPSRFPFVQNQGVRYRVEAALSTKRQTAPEGARGNSHLCGRRCAWPGRSSGAVTAAN
jgi:hypothetical protein